MDMVPCVALRYDLAQCYAVPRGDAWQWHLVRTIL